jgi:hypothetical protein
MRGRCFGARTRAMVVAIVYAMKGGSITHTATVAVVTKITVARARIGTGCSTQAVATASVLIGAGRSATGARDTFWAVITSGTGVAMQPCFIDGATLKHRCVFAQQHRRTSNCLRFLGLQRHRDGVLLAITAATTTLRALAVFHTTITTFARIPRVLAGTGMPGRVLATTVALFQIVTANDRGTTFRIANFTRQTLVMKVARADVGCRAFAIATAFRLTFGCNVCTRGRAATVARPSFLACTHVRRSTGAMGTPLRAHKISALFGGSIPFGARGTCRPIHRIVGPTFVTKARAIATVRASTVTGTMPGTHGSRIGILGMASTALRSIMGRVTRAAIFLSVPSWLARACIGLGARAVAVAISIAIGFALASQGVG